MLKELGIIGTIRRIVCPEKYVRHDRLANSFLYGYDDRTIIPKHTHIHGHLHSLESDSSSNSNNPENPINPDQISSDKP